MTVKGTAYQFLPDGDRLTSAVSIEGIWRQDPDSTASKIIYLNKDEARLDVRNHENGYSFEVKGEAARSVKLYVNDSPTNDMVKTLGPEDRFYATIDGAGSAKLRFTPNAERK